MTRPHTSLRWKIALLAAAAACAAAVVIGLLVHRSTYERSLTLGRGSALTALADIPAAPTSTPDRDTHGDPVTRRADEIPPQLVHDVRQTGGLPRTWYDDRKPDTPWMWAARFEDGRWTAVRVEMGSDKRNLDALDRHMAYAALAALALVAPLAALAAVPMTRRLRRVAVTARRITHGDLDARTGSTGTGHDETADISEAVDRMADALRRRLHDEQRFTADVAHELRTPLMGLVTAASLLPESEATDLVRDRVRVLRDLVEDLLEISRLDAGAEHAETLPVPLGSVVEDAVARARTGPATDVTVTVTGDATVETDPRRLDRILANLVTNAHRHGRPPVTVTVTGTEIVVQDRGSGFPDDLLTHGPQRFRTGAEERGTGHGLGLTIALGQARVIGAHMEFANAPEGGARVTLRLPPPTAEPPGP
ncbi:two-component sensor histidine kinase [Streptomyces griseocarneus]|nr:two-component sensor histidine kinase [Streptomyces griseocarneus]